MKKQSTLGNKILAVCLLVVSAIPMIMEKEATGFIFVCTVAIPLFFAKKKLYLSMKGSTWTLSLFYAKFTNGIMRKKW